MKKKLQICYFGSPLFSAQLLEKLILDKTIPFEVKLVVTQPDKPVGRKQIMTPSPVKQIAQKYGIEVISQISNTQHPITNEKSMINDQLKNENSLNIEDWVLKINECDLALVFAYGFKQLIPMNILQAPKLRFPIENNRQSGFINIHPSLLPLYRGSSPIAYPLIMGDKQTGVTLFVMDEKMDHGPIIAQEKVDLNSDETRPQLEQQLTQLGFEMIKKLILTKPVESDFNPSTPLRVNQLQLIQQDHKLSTRAPYMTKQDGFISWEVLQKCLKNQPLRFAELPLLLQKYYRKYKSEFLNPKSPIYQQEDETNSNLKIKNSKLDIVSDFDIHASDFIPFSSAVMLYNFWRGMTPWPGIWTYLPQPPQPRRLRGQRQNASNNNEKRLKIVSLFLNKSIPASYRLSHNSYLCIKTVQLEGKKEVDFETFNAAYQVFTP